MTHNKNCEYCGEKYSTNLSRQKYCSAECRKDDRRKPESWYDMLGGDGENPVYSSEGMWYLPDGSVWHN